MKRFKNYVKEFIQDESGMELLQMAIAVVVTVALIGVAFKVKSVVSKNISDAADQANSSMQDLLNGRNPGED